MNDDIKIDNVYEQTSTSNEYRVIRIKCLSIIRFSAKEEKNTEPILR